MPIPCPGPPLVSFPIATLLALQVRAFLLGILFLLFAPLCDAQPYFASPTGSDLNAGTLDQPFATLQRAQRAARNKPGDVILRGGTYYLSAPLVLSSQDSGSKDAPVAFRNYPGEQAVISGGVRLARLQWRHCRGTGEGGRSGRGVRGQTWEGEWRPGRGRD